MQGRNSEYVFSWCAIERTPELVRRPWWNVFGRDKVVMIPRLSRKAFVGLSKEEADVLVEASRTGYTTAVGSLLVRMMGEKPQMTQLEEGSRCSEYVSTYVVGS